MWPMTAKKQVRILDEKTRLLKAGGDVLFHKLYCLYSNLMVIP